MTHEDRPNPDALLEHVKREEPSPEGSGRLHLFFGYAAGVGKTYAMLEAARALKAEGRDVVAGFIQPHGRSETELLLKGLEALPHHKVPYRNITLEEFDLDAALARKPEVILVDELAHTNAPESRHPKRWQDIEELLEAGITVYTTMNVQHLETLNDLVAQITGVIVQETIPDGFLEKVDEIEIIDLPPDDLLERLKQGKVYVPQQAAQALASFFKKPNLIALREVALRRTAQFINPQVQSAREVAGSRKTWPTTERLLVCVGPSPTSLKVIRAAKRLSMALEAEWIAAHVETPQAQKISPEARRRLNDHLHLAEELGAEIVTLGGVNRAEEIVKYASQRNVSKIIVGKTPRSKWYRQMHGSVADEIQLKSAGIDVYIIPGDTDKTAPLPTSARPVSFDAKKYWRSLPVMAICAAIAYAAHVLGLAEANKTMIFLLGVIFVAARYGRGPGIMASVISVLIFDFLMVEPYYTFSVNDTQYLLTFAVMLGIAVLISTLTSRITQQAAMLRQRMHRAESLYRLTQRLSSSIGLYQIATEAEQALAEILQCDVALLLSQEHDKLAPLTQSSSFLDDRSEEGVALWALKNRKIAGQGSDTLPKAKAVYVPLIGASKAIGVMAVSREARDTTTSYLSNEQRHLYETCAGQVALALEREMLSDQAKQMLVDVETERLRSSVLSSISHDFRTPLTLIVGASSQLLEDKSLDSHASAHEFALTIFEQSSRLNRYVTNLLEITRIESGAVKPDRQWNVIEDVIGSAVASLSSDLARYKLKLDVPPEMPPIMLDSVLIERVLINLLENAMRFSPAGGEIELTARDAGKEVRVEVADRGPGIAAGEEKLIFNKFHRKDTGRLGNNAGTGLGLSICEAIIRLHNGSIMAENREGGGARFIFTLPRDILPEAENG